MRSCDLHVHSVHSGRPSHWLLSRLSFREALSDPEQVYHLAKRRGMDFVTITDHNAIDGACALVDAHPADTFTGVELTCRLPADDCKVHLLVWGLSVQQFTELIALRHDLRDVRDYVRQERLAHAVAHATFAVNHRLSLDVLEQLMLLFDSFEGLNGSRPDAASSVWREVLLSLSPEHIEGLAAKHGIDPFSDTSWIKGFTAGSDDHAGLFIGATHTVAPCHSPETFLQQIRGRKGSVAGRCNSFEGLGFVLIRATLEQNRSGSSRQPAVVSLMQAIESSLTDRRPGLRSRMVIRRACRSATLGETTKAALQKLTARAGCAPSSLDTRIDDAYQAVSAMLDDLVAGAAVAVTRHGAEQGSLGLSGALGGLIAACLVAGPFLGCLEHLSRDKVLLDELHVRYLARPLVKKRRLVWLTDSLTDMNGPSMIIRDFAREMDRRAPGSLIVASCSDMGTSAPSPGHAPLPWCHEFQMPLYDRYRLRIPSLLSGLRLIAGFDSGAILISTPGPVGLLGLLAARCLHIPCAGIYHTDFAAQAREIIAMSCGETEIEPDHSGRPRDLAAAVASYCRWFYGQMDEVLAPSSTYEDRLEISGVPRHRIRLFRRGLDATLFRPRPDARHRLAAHHALPPGPLLLFAGRVSHDKSVNLLLHAFELVAGREPGCTLMVAGDGPALPEMRERAQGRRDVIFAGQVPRHDLPDYYSAADLLVFPSRTDTFGMVVMEAQACGLPALVSDCGGPRDIIVDEATGFVVAGNDAEGWARAISCALALRLADPDRWDAMREASRRRVLAQHDWDVALADLFSGTLRPAAPAAGLRLQVPARSSVSQDTAGTERTTPMLAGAPS